MTEFSDTSEFANSFKKGLLMQRKEMLTAALNDAQRHYAGAVLNLHKAQQALNQLHNQETS